MNDMKETLTIIKYKKKIEDLQLQLYEAQETLEAIRTGQVDALVVHHRDGHKLYTLQTADHAYRVFIQSMNEGAVTVNKDGIILYCNSTFATILGKPLSRIMGKSFMGFLTADTKSQVESLFKKCWSRNCKSEAKLVSKNEDISVLLSLKALRIEEQATLSIIVTNLTDLKQSQKLLETKNKDLESLNKALEVSNHDLQQFASVASHDLQEPLRKIYMFSDLLVNKEMKSISHDSKVYLEKIISSASRMKALVVDMLNYSKLSSGNDQLTKVNLASVLKEVKEDLELVIKEKNAVIVSKKLPVVLCNRGQLRQVFQNIIYNALKFSKQNVEPRIEITSKIIALNNWESIEDRNGSFCVISIIDNGIGFDEKHGQAIFNLFERLNAKDAYEGTGIGLSITKKIIEKHGGKIKAEGKKDEGAKFSILLPIINNS
jgi:PAS domain S-box-containing protein